MPAQQIIHWISSQAILALPLRCSAVIAEADKQNPKKSIVVVKRFRRNWRHVLQKSLQLFASTETDHCSLAGPDRHCEQRPTQKRRQSASQ